MKEVRSWSYRTLLIWFYPLWQNERIPEMNKTLALSGI
jgi:hypothetical protein